MSRPRFTAKRLAAVLMGCVVAAALSLGVSQYWWPGGPALNAYKAPGGRFVIELPGQVKQAVRPLGTPEGPIQTQMYACRTQRHRFFIAYGDFPRAYAQAKGANALLDSLQQAAIRFTGGEVLSLDDRDFQGHPARRLRWRAERGGLRLRALLVVAGRRFYQLVAIAPPAAADTPVIDRVFGSFRLISAAKASGLKTYQPPRR